MTWTRYAYLHAALDAELGSLRKTTSGRACATFRAGAAIGGLVGAGAITHEEAEGLLLDAALDTGLSEREARGHIQRGLRCGERTPRTLPDDGPCDRPYRPLIHHQAEAERPPARPPNAEVDALWSVSLPVGSDPEVAGWFCYRYQSSAVCEQIELWDLARAMPASPDLPSWARSRGGPWNRTGHRILFRLWDHTGQAVSLRARCPDPNVTPKSLVPFRFSVKGLVLADPLGVQLLSGIVPDWWEPREIVVSEGEVDWATWGTRQRESEPQGPACFGVDAGSWSWTIADRIPDGSAVVLRTHHDPPGEQYAEQIASTLRGRCRLFRSMPAGEVAR
jgi:hypothetical protein